VHPASLPPSREYPPIRDDEIVARRKVVFSSRRNNKRIQTGFEFLVNGRIYDEITPLPRPAA
jgi:hypothetical protein